uniref:Uncharacterized protein n=1 Tax=Nelumbo nucifera TaxID=4432 RepID=A0A822ZAH5_NELNU|nr:TPA_asm: hypothetical protein HUJ06_015896 [Nelumbo nucifera]
MFEFGEVDLWNLNHDTSPKLKKPMTNVRATKKLGKRVENADRGGGAVATSTSLPVNIPNWSKILKEDYEDTRRRENYDNFDDEDKDSENNKWRRTSERLMMTRTRILKEDYQMPAKSNRGVKFTLVRFYTSTKRCLKGKIKRFKSPLG